MKKIAFILFALSITATSCNKKAEVPMTQEQINKKVDSITTSRMKDLDHMANQDLQRRIKIEVKIKADSIVNLMKMKSDSALNKTAAPITKDSTVPATPAK